MRMMIGKVRAMTNREKYFNNMDSYDLLLMMKANLERIGVFCPIDVITGKKPECMTVDKPYIDGVASCIYRDCESCIQKFLNSESRS